MIGLAAVGAVDDLVKIFRPQNGLSVGVKLAAQSAVVLGPALVLFLHQESVPHALDFKLPTGMVGFDMGWWFVPWATLVIVGSSNAVNLTDGLDGLAGGCLVLATAALAVLAYASGAGLPIVSDAVPLAGAGEFAVIACGMIGGLLGFLWFNRHPARVFMGDTGSLPLGGLLGFIAVAMRQEMLLIVIGGVFVAEALSVIIQVGYFKWCRRRLFLCAPLHHHFQFKGWSERRIVTRFWLAGACCAILGVGVANVANDRAHDTNPTRKRGKAAVLASPMPSHRGNDAGSSSLALRLSVCRPVDATSSKISRRPANNRLSVPAREPGASSSGQ
jgi:phospho-N-acetylmuramoyl-pentapeptide-transferase